MYFIVRKAFTFSNNEKGAVAVEAALYFVVFFMFCAILYDFSTVFINKGHLERINYSLTSILRERSRFYEGREEVSQNDVNQLDVLAAKLLSDSRIGNNYHLQVDAVYFNAEKDRKVVRLIQSFTGSSNNCELQDSLNLDALISLSPYGSYGNEEKYWLPVYQVTLCIPKGESLFKRFLSIGDKKLGRIIVSNAVIPRVMKEK